MVPGVPAYVLRNISLVSLVSFVLRALFVETCVLFGIEERQMHCIYRRDRSVDGSKISSMFLLRIDSLASRNANDCTLLKELREIFN